MAEVYRYIGGGGSILYRLGLYKWVFVINSLIFFIAIRVLFLSRLNFNSWSRKVLLSRLNSSLICGTPLLYIFSVSFVKEVTL